MSSLDPAWRSTAYRADAGQCPQSAQWLKVRSKGHKEKEVTLTMQDTLTSEARSRLMSRVRGRNTRPELHVRRTLWTDGFRYRLHVRDLPGTPDLVLSKYRLAVFVHGCFWHQHGCKKSKRPASNRKFWDSKFDANVSRDVRNRTRLEDRGWTVTTIWECKLESDTESLLTLLRELRSNGGTELSANPTGVVSLRS